MKRIKVTVVSQRGECIKNHTKGDTCYINSEGVEGRICIHSLYSLLPKAFAMLYDAEFPWLKEGEPVTHACPDAFNPVIFSLEKEERP